MDGLSQFQTKLASFTPGVDDWNTFKKENNIKGRDLAKALEGFAEQFERLPMLGQKDRSEFFATRLPHIIQDVSDRAAELRDPAAPKTVFDRVFGGGVAGKKDEETASLRDSLAKLQTGLASLNPTAWGRASMPTGAAVSIETPIARDASQADRDLTGRGNYFLQNGTGTWEKLENNAPTIRGLLMAQGASEADARRAMSVATQDTLNSLSTTLAAPTDGSAPTFLNIPSSAVYFAVMPGGVGVHIEAEAQLRTDLRRADAPTEKVNLMAVFNPAENPASTCIRMYK